MLAFILPGASMSKSTSNINLAWPLALTIGIVRLGFLA
jgi:hypothetical protein